MDDTNPADGQSASVPVTICGFWRRIGALLIDSIILGVIGFCAGLVLHRQFILMGEWGRAVGFLVAGAYFSMGTGRLGNGRTLGGRILDVQVVKTDGSPPETWRAFLRYSVIGLPWFLNNLAFTSTVLESSMSWLLSFLIFGVGLTAIYLIVFNRGSRRSLHDLLLSTYVVHRGNGLPVPAAKLPFIHALVSAVLLLAPFSFPFFADKATQGGPFPAFKKIMAEIEVMPMVATVGVEENKTHVFPDEGKGSRASLTVAAVLKTDRIDDLEVAARMVRVVFQEYPKAFNKDAIGVRLSYGYDIGIAESWKRNQHTHRPSEWQEIITRQIPGGD